MKLKEHRSVVFSEFLKWNNGVYFKLVFHSHPYTIWLANWLSGRWLGSKVCMFGPEICHLMKYYDQKSKSKFWPHSLRLWSLTPPPPLKHKINLRPDLKWSLLLHYNDKVCFLLLIVSYTPLPPPWNIHVWTLKALHSFTNTLHTLYEMQQNNTEECKIFDHFEKPVLISKCTCIYIIIWPQCPSVWNSMCYIILLNYRESSSKGGLMFHSMFWRHSNLFIFVKQIASTSMCIGWNTIIIS